MRKVTQAEYELGKAALALYQEFSKPYVQKNGWTVTPVDAPDRPFTCDEINAHSTNVELFELERDCPGKFTAYASVSNIRSDVTTWTGELIARVTHQGSWHTNNMGGRWRQLTIRADWNMSYTGREYDSRQCVNFRKCKA